MPITDEQAKFIKEQILKQIENLPADKRDQIKDYILSMNNEQLEEFLKQNNAQIRSDDTNQPEQSPQYQDSKKSTECIMCLLSNKQVESMAIYEDKDYLAALEINPFSKGHIILIPKKHIKDSKSIKSKAFTIANRIGRHLVKKLKAEDFQITTSDDLKHAIINIIPRYKGEKPGFERKPITKQQLNDLSMQIGKIEQKKKIEKVKTDYPEKRQEKGSSAKTEVKSNIIHLSRRIP